MKQDQPARRRQSWRRATAVAMGLPLLITSGIGASSAFAAPENSTSQVAGQIQQNFKDGNYIVVLKDAPVASYEGGVSGIAATKPAPGKKINKGDKNVKAYEAHLRKQQRAVASSQGVKIQKDYTVAINGFAAKLTAAQATELSKQKNVLTVAEDKQFAPDYSSTDFLGLSGKNGGWATQYGGTANAGKGTVVGVIDSGYRPDNAFLKGNPVKPLSGKATVGQPYLDKDGTIAMLKADGTTFKGECQVGEDFDGSACNDKVLSARYFADAFVGSIPEDERAPEEVISPVDVGSHGTHTASTAAGNYGVDLESAGRDFGKGSGIAPAAKLSVYKICWEDTDPDTGGCYTSASVAAIEQSILDGVDVLNYSISGNNNSIVDPVAIAFKNAAAAGIFVSASAGNSGPTPTTVNHASPWLTTVAASTFSNELMGTVELSDGTKYRGVSVMSSEVQDKPLVLSADAVAAGQEAADAALCLPNSLDPAKVTGKIVICDRGVNARAEKSVVVADAGGVGMVLVNISTGSEDSDVHAVPTVHISNPEIKTRVAANPSLTGSLIDHDTTGLPQTPLPQIAGFSSRGQTLAEGSDLLKPDLAAPGVNVLAGVVPEAYNGDSTGFMSGTSMAAPHVAGYAALMFSKYPTWSPSAVKSAMMTTSYDVLNNDGSKNLDNFATGAGEADPNKMTNPGLVYENDVNDWDALINGELDAKNVNLASYAVGSLVGDVTVTREVTALTKGTYVASANVPGVDVKVSPSTLKFAKAGEKKSFTVTFKNVSAATNKFTHGSLSWNYLGTGIGNSAGKGKAQFSVNSPVSVRPLAVAAPNLVEFSGASGKGSFDVLGGVTTNADLSVLGLAKGDVTPTGAKKPGEGAVIGSNSSTATKVVKVAEGTKTATFSVNADDANDDWDMLIVTPGNQVLQIATESASESTVINNPAPGTYYVIGNLYATNDNGAANATIEYVGLTGDAGNMTASPDPLALANGKTSTVNLAWDGLTEGNWYGSVILGDTGSAVGVKVAVGTNGAAVSTSNVKVYNQSDIDKLPKSSLKKS
ncbi:S8 family serine peptidase [Neomicrococcus aestuarii]|nr:S8 family serine peptidase [Neomicrococcus aestuarii]